MSDNKSYEVKPHYRVRNRAWPFYDEPGNEKLTRVLDIFYVGYEWELVKQGRTQGGGTELKYSYRKGLVFPYESDEKYNVWWNIRTAFEGLQLHYWKWLADDETAELAFHEGTQQVAPDEYVYIYQKKYKFNVVIWFNLDAWGKEWTVGFRHYDTRAVVQVHARVWSDEFIKRSNPLEGSVEVRPEILDYPVEATEHDIKRFQDCTSKCQNYLSDRGFNL
jgi:hypothetical protein